jgi:hypothetical protein
MGGWSSRQAALGAFAVVILWLVGFFIAGTPPQFAAPPEKIVHYYVTHHHQVLIAVVLVAIGIVVYLAVLAQLSLLLRGAGERSLAAVVMLATGASAAVFAIGDAIYGVITQVVQMPGADPGLAKAFYELDQFAGVPLYWLVLANVVAVAIAGHRGVFPRWTVWLNAVFAVLIALGGISVRASGLFAAGTGHVANLAFAAALVFLLEVGILLSRPGPVGAPQITE